MCFSFVVCLRWNFNNNNTPSSVEFPLNGIEPYHTLPHSSRVHSISTDEHLCLRECALDCTSIFVYLFCQLTIHSNNKKIFACRMKYYAIHCISHSTSNCIHLFIFYGCFSFIFLYLCSYSYRIVFLSLLFAESDDSEQTKMTRLMSTFHRSNKLNGTIFVSTNLRQSNNSVNNLQNDSAYPFEKIQCQMEWAARR